MLSGVTFDLWEWLVLPIYLFLIFMLALFYQRSKVKNNPLYRFYTSGLMAHIAGGLFLGIIYQYYYQGGDTFGYFLGSVSMDNLLFQSPAGWISNEFGHISPHTYSFFNDTTGYPMGYMYYDPRTFMVIRIINIIMLPAFNSYLLATVLVAWFCYAGMWKLYMVFAKFYPNIEGELAFAILFFPSVLFWGAGILKDSITLSATGWVTYSIYTVFIAKKKRLIYTVILLFSLFIVTIIRPYIVIALIPGSFMWIFAQRIYAVKNMAVKVFVLPLVIIGSMGGGYFVLTKMGSLMNKFSVQKIFETAKTTQNDLKQSYYGGHSFDIGLSDNATPADFLKKTPQAFVAGIFRPFIWESGNAVMLLSGLENTFILIISIYILVQIKFIAIYRRIMREPLLFFALTFSCFFACMVGVTTANFGALVRFKIAYLPFFISCLFILYKGKLWEPEKIESEEAPRRLISRVS